MEFIIADTFTTSLARLTGEEQKHVKTTAFDLQMNAANPGMQFHKLDKAKDKNFWSVRVGSDIRLIVHKNKNSLLLCYVDHHDKAYDWAERRKLEIHPATGAAQLVEIRERVQEIIVPVYVQEVQKKVEKKLFANTSNEILLSYGVPEEWLADVKEATENTLLALFDHLPAEAAEALWELATGGKPIIASPITAVENPFQHPDALRRFRTMNDKEELERALEFPWDKWAVFLHPAQRQWVERNYNGPARVSGSAGTGKTIVALHRAVHLAKTNAGSRVLLATFSPILANALSVKLRRLISNQPKINEQIDIYSFNELGIVLYEANVGTPLIMSGNDLERYLYENSKKVNGHNFTSKFLKSEWELVVDAWQLHSWEEYRDVKRLGRKKRLTEDQRELLWFIFDLVNLHKRTEKKVTINEIFSTLADHFSGNNLFPYDFAVVDEAQDISAMQLKMLSVISSAKNALFFAGDIGQRIFQQAFSWKSLGIDVRGRSRTLHVNYRTSHQIRQQADKLLGAEVTDADGNREERNKTVSVFNGPQPNIKTFKSEEDETAFVAAWIIAQVDQGVALHEIGVFVRSDKQIVRATNAVEFSGKKFTVLDERVETFSDEIAISTMHLAKGLEFKCVAVIACDDEIIPLQERIDTVTEQSDLEEVYNTERHLLYVACTRARDSLLVTSTEPASEFLEDLGK